MLLITQNYHNIDDVLFNEVDICFLDNRKWSIFEIILNEIGPAWNMFRKLFQLVLDVLLMKIGCGIPYINFSCHCNRKILMIIKYNNKDIKSIFCENMLWTPDISSVCTIQIILIFPWCGYFRKANVRYKRPSMFCSPNTKPVNDMLRWERVHGNPLQLCRHLLYSTSLYHFSDGLLLHWIRNFASLFHCSFWAF